MQVHAENLIYTMGLMEVGSFLLVIPEYPGDSRVEMSVFKHTDGCWYYTDKQPADVPVETWLWAGYITDNEVRLLEF